MLFRRGRGKEIHETAITCPACGAPQTAINEASNNRWMATLLLCLCLGNLGAHRLYVGKIGTGLIQLFTFGSLGVWMLIDLVMIITLSFKDKDGCRIG